MDNNTFLWAIIIVGLALWLGKKKTAAAASEKKVAEQIKLQIPTPMPKFNPITGKFQ